jgi:hypothetical protein
MTDEVLDFLRERFLRLDQRLDAIETELRDLRAGQTVMTDMLMRFAREMVQVKDLLGRMDNRIRKLEDAPPLP